MDRFFAGIGAPHDGGDLDVGARVEETVRGRRGSTEQAAAFQARIEAALAPGFEAELLGVRVRVVALAYGRGGELVAVCRRGRREQRVPLLDLPAPLPRPRGWEWVEAYRAWLEG